MQNRDAEFKSPVGRDDPDRTAGTAMATKSPAAPFLLPSLLSPALFRLVANNPVSATQLFKKVFDAILECMHSTIR